MRWLIASPLGALVGFALGAVGGGGSVLAVPLLVFGAGMNPRVATTGSLVVVGVTALGGALAHARTGRVHLRAALVLSAAAALWSVAGSWLNRSVHPDVILLAFGLLTLPVASAMWKRGQRARTRVPVPAGARGPSADPAASSPVTARGPAGTAPTRVLSIVVAGGAVGLLTGFLGVGGGFVVVPALVFALRLPMADAVGTSLVVIAANTGIALLARLPAGAEIPWLVVLAFSGAGVLGALAGNRVAGRARPGSLERGFAVTVLVMGALTALRAAGSL